MSTKLGDANTKKLVTGRLYFQRKTAGTLESNWLDFGNAKSHKTAFDIQRADHMASADGINSTDLSLVKSVKRAYDFELDEVTPDLERLRQLAGAGSTTTQSSATVTAETLVTSASKQGRTYFTAKQGISSVVVKVSSSAKTLGTDYTVDLGSGAIYIIPGGGINDNSTVTVDYVAAEVVTVAHTAFAELLAEGNFKYIEKDQFSSVPREVTTFYGQCYVTSWGENSNDYNVTTLQALAWTNPVTNTRKD